MTLWLEHGRPHREGGPAEVVAYDSGQLSRELYFRRGKRHRDGAPAETHWHPDGEVCIVGWWYRDQLHCEVGPAWVEDVGMMLEWHWFLHGQELTEEEWAARVDE
jgi:hypothetical protein